MGQARARQQQRLQAMRDAVLFQSERWAKPGSALEAEWHREVSAGNHELVVTQRREALIRGGMIANDCHVNCSSQERNDPTGAAKHVVGWWQQGDCYVLHSVIEQNGDLYCITPQHFDVPAFMFVRDKKLQWVPLGEDRVLRREGHEPMVGLRKDPARFIESHRKLTQKLSEGLDVLEAMEAVDAELGGP